MNTIDISQIIIPPDRQRQEISSDHLLNLATDFAEIGILQPLVLRKVEDEVHLVVGECRLRACRMYFQKHEQLRHNDTELPRHHVPFSWLGDLSEREIFQAELHENRYRQSLTLIEESKAITRYMELRRTEDPTITDKTLTAELYPERSNASSPTAILRSAELIAKHSEMPEVAKAKSRAEAIRAIERKTLGDFNSMMGAAAIAAYTGEHIHIKGDATIVLPTLDSEQFDCIVTDPPYGVGANSFGGQQEQSHNYDDSPAMFHGLMRCVIPEFYRVCSEEAHVYHFCDPRHFEFLVRLYTEAGFDVWKRPLIWHKAVGPSANVGLLPRPEHGPRNTYDCILYAIKGDKKVKAVHPDVINSYPRISTTGHPAEKPADLYKHLLSRSCSPGDRVLDAFAGGGPIFPASNALHLIATGINLTEEDYQLANTRLTEHL